MNINASGENNSHWAAARHIIPFVIWLGIMSLPMSNVAFRYAIQSVFGLGVLLVLRPWQYYNAVNIRSLPLGILVGAGVAVVWILPESIWAHHYFAADGVYARLFFRGSGMGAGEMYAPERCGWVFSVIRLYGSAFVIAAIEEFFWRGFLMRWLVKPDFISVDPGKIGWGIFMIAAIAFGLEHGNRWLVGMMAGLAYGLLYLRKGDIGAAITAHVTTNYLLGLYVLATGSYQFW